METLLKMIKRYKENDQQIAFIEHMYDMGAVTAGEAIDALEKLSQQLKEDMEEITMEPIKKENAYHMQTIN